MNVEMKDDHVNAVAIIGLEGRFPLAEDLDAFWDNLIEGKECLTKFDQDTLDPGLPRNLLQDPNYIPVRGTMPHADKFDAEFFGISPREAEMLDPQHRVFLEMAWRALENAGYAAGTFDGLTGVFGCMSNNSYFQNHVAKHPDVLELFGELPAMVANEKDYITTRVSYKLNLRGPSLSFSTACSSSLVAVCHAYHSLLDYQCDIALAGGIAIACPQEQGYYFQEGGIHAADGHCRAFDASAKGTVFSNGGGLVVLKRLADALADNDTIHAVIRGAAMNNDGAGRVSLTAPGIEGQSQVVELAQAFANVSPEEISYIEAHGTGTPLGDPIEVESLTRAFRAGMKDGARSNYCALGSAKPAIGHLDVAAGIAGLLKTVMALKHRRIPATVNFRNINPELKLDDSPFYIAKEPMDWKSINGKRLAGVSAFGLGGTNAHVIVEEAPELSPTDATARMQLLPVSAKTDAALARNLNALADHIEAYPDLKLADAAYTLQLGRAALPKRAVIVAQDRADAIARLREATNSLASTRAFDRPPSVVFMFPGQGVQRAGMMQEIYRREPVFKDAVDCCADILSGEIDHDIRDLIFGRHPNAAELLDETRYTQPALFTVEYALAQLWISWGVQPSLLAGHSIGEYPAAALAGIFRLQDALRIVAARGKLMWQQARGSMLSVRLAEKDLLSYLSPEITLAAVNAPQLCVVSGSDTAISELSQRLEKDDVPYSRLHTSHAFHSPMMDPVADVFEDIVRQFELSPPSIPIVSTMTGEILSDAEAVDPAYWAQQLRQPVRFYAAMRAIDAVLSEGGPKFLIDVGPGIATSTFARQHFAGDNITAIEASTGRAETAEDEYRNLLSALGSFWARGGRPDWPVIHQDEYRRRIPLPGYSFERTRYWLESTGIRTANAGQATVADASTIMGGGLVDRLALTLTEAAGISIDSIKPSMKFATLGLDSLFLIQFSQLLKNRFGLDLRVRQLLDEYDNLEAISKLLKEGEEKAPSAISEQVPAHGNGGKPRDYKRGEVPPVPGARLGRRPDGTPGWFIPDPNRPGAYREIQN